MTPPPTPLRSRLALAIFWGGLLAGTWDITFAFVYYGLRKGATVLGVLQSVAGGLLGRDAARAGGAATAALGLACHYFIAFAAAAIFVGASRVIPALTRHAVVSGLLFGAAVYVVMNQLVIPLSGYHAPWGRWENEFHWPLLAHLVGVGLPIAFATRRLAPR